MKLSPSETIAVGPVPGPASDGCAGWLTTVNSAATTAIMQCEWETNAGFSYPKISRHQATPSELIAIELATTCPCARMAGCSADYAH